MEFEKWHKDVYIKAIVSYGVSLQTDVAIEEMAELTKELIKKKRGNDNNSSISEEVADVYIMLEQLKLMYGLSEQAIAMLIDHKTTRLKERLDI